VKEYHKINTIYKRDEKGNLLEGIFSLPEFKYLQNNKWIFTEKVDGTNIRIIWDTQIIRFGGKTDNAQIPTFLISKLQDLFPVTKFQEHFPSTPLCLYGEGYGAKIQKDGGNYIPNGVDFVLFDILIDLWWLKREDIEEVANKLNIKTIPVVGNGTLQDSIDIIKSNSLKSAWGNFLVEGLVLKPEIELFSRNGNRIITKIKHKDFKIKKEQKNG
jgi:ATP-dependent RNA circularization protein (DNA/RNA ligase family)